MLLGPLGPKGFCAWGIATRESVARGLFCQPYLPRGFIRRHLISQLSTQGFFSPQKFELYFVYGNLGSVSASSKDVGDAKDQRDRGHL